MKKISVTIVSEINTETATPTSAYIGIKIKFNTKLTNAPPNTQ